MSIVSTVGTAHAQVGSNQEAMFRRFLQESVIPLVEQSTKEAQHAGSGCPTCEVQSETPMTRRENGTWYRGTPYTEALPQLCSEEWKFLREINAYRAANGVAPLRVSARLTNAAQWHAVDMGVSDHFDHTDSTGTTAVARAAKFGYWELPFAENIAAGSSSATEVFESWRTSPGHDRNMLNSAYTVIGIARRNVPGARYGGLYWATPFGGFEYPGDLVSEPAVSPPCR